MRLVIIRKEVGGGLAAYQQSRLAHCLVTTPSLYQSAVIYLSPHAKSDVEVNSHAFIIKVNGTCRLDRQHVGEENSSAWSRAGVGCGWLLCGCWLSLVAQRPSF